MNQQNDNSFKIDDKEEVVDENKKSRVEKARRDLLETVRREGIDVGSFEDAWARILGVQAEIALDASMGSKATTAAKFLREVYGEGGEKDQSDDGGISIKGMEATRRLLDLITEEKERRGETSDE